MSFLAFQYPPSSNQWYYWEFGCHGLRTVSINTDHVFWVSSVPPRLTSKIWRLELGSSCGLNASYHIILSAELRIKKVMISKSFPSSRINNGMMPVGLDRWRLDTHMKLWFLDWLGVLWQQWLMEHWLQSHWSNGQVSLATCHVEMWVYFLRAFIIPLKPHLIPSHPSVLPSLFSTPFWVQSRWEGTCFEFDSSTVNLPGYLSQKTGWYFLEIATSTWGVLIHSGRGPGRLGAKENC